MTEEQWAELRPYAERVAAMWRTFVATDSADPEHYRAVAEHEEALAALNDAKRGMGLA